MANDAPGVAAFGALHDDLQAAALAEHAAAAAVAAAAVVGDAQHHHHPSQATQAAILVAAAQPHLVPAVESFQAQLQAPLKKRKGGRQKDPVWQETTIVDGKEVVCNKCHTVIHRYGCTKVERVRAHFENKCVFTKRPKIQHDDTEATDEHGDAKVRYRSEYATKLGMFKRRIAQWVYTSGHPFNEAKNHFLRNAFKILRPDTTLPTQYELENDLLEIEFNASLGKVTRSLSGKAACLTLESWVDTNGQSMTNYSAYCEGTPYFLETMPSPGSDKEFIGEEIERVLLKYKKAIIYGILAPLSENVSKASREKIQRKFPQCAFVYGCIANALRLLMTDLCEILPWLGAIHGSVLELIQVFQHNPKLRNLLRNLQHAESKPALVVPDEAIGTSFCDTLDSVLKSERELVALVSRRDFLELRSSPREDEVLQRIQNFVLGETFLQDVLNALNILHPLQQQLTRVQAERVPISYVYNCFLELLALYSQMEHVNKKDKALISSCVNERFNSIYGDCHGIAYVLDPIYLGINMDEAKKQEVESYIVTCCTHVLHAGGIDILDQLEKYRSMVQQLKECNPQYWDLLLTGKVRPFDFWVERRQFPQLQQLAWVVFSLPVANAIPGQHFAPSCATIHAKFNMQLPPEKLYKLTQVYCNSRLQQLDSKEPEPILSIVLHDPDDPSSTQV